MKECLVIGQTNVGKTVFVVNFARFLGLKKLEMSFRYPDGMLVKKSYQMEGARQELVGSTPHTTRALQSIIVQLPAGKGKKELTITDTSGLTDSIHKDEIVRRAMAQTLASVRQADLIIHLLDAARVGETNGSEGIGTIDYQVAEFAQMRGNYCILANKMDIPAARLGYVKIRQEFPGHLILPVSALKQTGLKEVKAFVLRTV